MNFPDYFSAHAADYRTFRPGYPPAAFEWLSTLPQEHSLAWDVGTGNGQAAVLLADHFDRVIATDPSANQIQNARPHQNVEYEVAPAESSPCADRSVDLVCIAQALHWFDLDRFYAKVRRVAKPGGILAALTYNFHSIAPAVDEVLAKYKARIAPYWPPQRSHVDASYRTIPFPFRELATPRFAMTESWPLAGYLGYLSTSSASKEYQKSHGHDPLDDLVPQFEAAWGDPAAAKTVTWQLVLRVGVVD